MCSPLVNFTRYHRPKGPVLPEFYSCVHFNIILIINYFYPSPRPYIPPSHYPVPSGELHFMVTQCFVFQVQVIPWVLSDSNYIKSSSQKLDAKKTVFVGALHGMLTAEGLAKIMNDLFDGVLYAGA